MKNIILIFSLILSIVLPSMAIKKIEANPINIAYMLAQDTDSACIANTLAYYGYQPVESSSASSASLSPLRGQTALVDTPYSTYRHPNGSIIRFTFKDTSKEQPYPYVEVKSNSSSRETDAVLTNLGFHKSGFLYEQKSGKYSRTQFTCKSGARDFMIFHKGRKPSKNL